jgi:hypothetical protein
VSKPLTEEEIREALKHIERPDALSIEDRIRIGAAIYKWDNSAKGFAVFDDWRKQSAYDATKTRQRWAKYSQPRSNGKERVTVGTLIKWAKERGWAGPAKRSRSKTTYKTIEQYVYRDADGRCRHRVSRNVEVKDGKPVVGKDGRSTRVSPLNTGMKAKLRTAVATGRMAKAQTPRSRTFCRSCSKRQRLVATSFCPRAKPRRTCSPAGA